MGVLRHRRIRRQETVPNDDELDPVDDEENDNDDQDYESPITTSSIGLPSTITKNPYDKVKTVGQEVVKKVPSKYAKKIC
jgi:hypothetical protein